MAAAAELPLAAPGMHRIAAAAAERAMGIVATPAAELPRTPKMIAAVIAVARACEPASGIEIAVIVVAAVVVIVAVHNHRLEEARMVLIVTVVAVPAVVGMTADAEEQADGRQEHAAFHKRRMAVVAAVKERVRIPAEVHKLIVARRDP